MSLCATRNTNREEDPLMGDLTDNAPDPSTRLRESRVYTPEPCPETPYDVLPDLAQAFGRLTDSLTNSRKPPAHAC